MNITKNLSSQDVVRCEEKEDRLLDFLGYYLELLDCSEHSDPKQKTVTLLARSPRSPVARALYAFASEMSDAAINLEVIFAQLEPTDLLSNWFDMVVDETSNTPRPVIRWAKTPSLMDAHEQLVLGTAMSWSGDSMRREPSKRDAFELFRSDCKESARYGIHAFQAIWEVSEPVPVRLSKALKTGKTDGAKPEEKTPAGTTKKPNVRTRH